MVKLGVPIPDIAPHDALLGLLRATSGHVAWLHAAVAQIDDLSNQEARVLVELYDSERDRLTRVAKACVEAGATDREVHVASSYADAIARALRAALDAIGGIPRGKEQRFREVLALELQMLEGAGSDALREPGAIYGAATSAKRSVSDG